MSAVNATAISSRRQFHARDPVGHTTFKFSKTFLQNVQLYGGTNNSCLFHVIVAPGERGGRFWMTLIIGTNSANGVKAVDGRTSQPATILVENNGTGYDFTWSIPAGVYTLVLDHALDHKHPGAKVNANITINQG